MIKCIVALDDAYGIGKDNSLPWPHNRRDMMWFKQHTSKKVVVMGSTTWLSLGHRAPLPNRINIVVSSRNRQLFPKASHVVKTIDIDTINRIKWIYPETDIFCIGGAQLISSSIEFIDEFIISRIPGIFSCDVKLDWDALSSNFSLGYQKKEEDIIFERWVKT